MQLRRDQSGDTIIEVLFSILIIGLSLSIAFQTSTKALQAIQRSQERTQALKIAESQIELLRYTARGSNDTEKTAFYNYVTGGGSRLVCVKASKDDNADVKLPDVGIVVHDSVSGNNRCKFNDNRYRVAIDANQGGASDNPYYDYTVSVLWDRLGSGGSSQEQLDLFYRLNRNQF